MSVLEYAEEVVTDFIGVSRSGKLKNSNGDQLAFPLTVSESVSDFILAAVFSNGMELLTHNLLYTYWRGLHDELTFSYESPSAIEYEEFNESELIGLKSTIFLGVSDTETFPPEVLVTDFVSASI